MEHQQIDTLNQSLTYTYEDGSNGTLAGRANGYTSPHASAAWTFDGAGRPATVANLTDTFAYGYRYTLNAGLHEGTTDPNIGIESEMPFTLTSPQVNTTLAYETTRDALAFRRNDLTGGTLSKFAYGLNALGQRIALTPTGSAFTTTTPLAWGYNPRGELTTATRSGNTAFERTYSYDGIGNRLTATDHNAAPTNYFADASGSTAGGSVLNQYAKIAYPGPTTLQPVHDLDGNLTTGPVPGPVTNSPNPGVPIPANATLTWDAEIRLVKAVLSTSTIYYEYDHQSRLIARTESGSTTRYLYEGWNRIAEYETNGTATTPKRTYLWGLDLSGTLQGAGGVGGLLITTLIANNSITNNYYPTYDGNGNISEYVNQSGVKAAHFEYDPFGNLTVDSDTNATEFPYRFSTKPQDPSTGLYYYGYRWYDPVTGRWPNRDPIEELGGLNIYGFLSNAGSSSSDYLGLKIVAPPQNYILEDKPCRKVNIKEFVKLQREWGGSLTPNERDFIIQGGCVGICAVSQDVNKENRGPHPENMQPEFYFPGKYTWCWAGLKGKSIAEQQKCPMTTKPLVWGKHGVWQDPNKAPQDGAAVDLAKNRIIGVGGKKSGKFDYITKLGDYYLHANGGFGMNPELLIIIICKKVPDKGTYPAEMWCASCCGDTANGNGYNDGYKK